MYSQAKTDGRRAREERVIRKARSSLTTYKHLLYRDYNHGPHLEALDRALEQVARYVETRGAEGIGRLIVEMPPRHGKTLTVSRLFPTWLLGKQPDKRVMLVSYGATLAYRNSRQARNLLRQNRYQAIFPGVELAHDSAAVDTWDLHEHEGGCDAMGITGGATGKGAHLLVIDDPIKSRAEAESSTYRNRIWDAYINDLYTRLEPGGAIVLMMTRWHEDDLIGRVLKQANDPDEETEHWTRLRLPALAEIDDALGRAPNEALWAWRFPVDRLRRIQRAVGDYVWSALYQQRPAPAEGGIFKRANFNLVQRIAPDRIIQVVRFWDLAMSEKTSADYTVGVKMARLDNGHYAILDVQRRQIEWDGVPAFMAEVALMDGPHVPIGFEQKGYMSRAGQALAADERLHHYAIFGYPKDTDKMTNALPFAARVGLQVVDVLDAWWTEDFLSEICSFPYAAHDDQVDAAAGAYEMLGQDLATDGELNYATPYSIGTGAY